MTLAVAEKISALETADFFRQRAARGTPQALHAILDRVRNVPAQMEDEIFKEKFAIAPNVNAPHGNPD